MHRPLVSFYLNGLCETPLIHAARQGPTSTAKYLLEHGANLASLSELGATALHHVAGIGHIELMELLLSVGVHVDSQSDSGTPLAGANVNTTAGGATPLHVAADIGNTELITRLIKAKADPSVTDDEDVEILLPLTSRVETVPDWSVDDIIEHMQAEEVNACDD
ncbi:ankyrin repeat family protein [Tanacetum coccineum]